MTHRKSPTVQIPGPLALFFFFVAVSIFVSCTANPPTLREVSVSEFWTPGESSPILTHIVLDIEVSEPDGVLDLETVVVEHIATQLQWVIPAGDLEVQEREDILRIRTSFLGYLPFPSSDSPPIPLGQYRVSAVDAGQQEDSAEFSLQRLSSQNISEAVQTETRTVSGLRDYLNQGGEGDMEIFVFSASGAFETLIDLRRDPDPNFAESDLVFLVQPLSFPGGYAYWNLASGPQN